MRFEIFASKTHVSKIVTQASMHVSAALVETCVHGMRGVTFLSDLTYLTNEDRAVGLRTALPRCVPTCSVCFEVFWTGSDRWEMV